jgi:hypothetical protein
MSHIHWVERQNKLEIPRDKDEVNKREIHECDGRVYDPDMMVVPLTPILRMIMGSMRMGRGARVMGQPHRPNRDRLTVFTSQQEQ